MQRPGRAWAFRFMAILASVMSFTIGEARGQFATQYLSKSYNLYAGTVTGYSLAETTYMGSHTLSAHVQISSPSGRTASSSSGFLPLSASTTTVLNVLYEDGDYWVQTANAEFCPVLNDWISLATLAGAQQVRKFIDVLQASFSPQSLDNDAAGTATLRVTVYPSSGVTQATFDGYEVSRTGITGAAFTPVSDASRGLTPGMSQIVNNLGSLTITNGTPTGILTGRVNVRAGGDTDIKNSPQSAQVTVTD